MNAPTIKIGSFEIHRILSLRFIKLVDANPDLPGWMDAAFYDAVIEDGVKQEEIALNNLI